ncbi:hypothetical protein L6R52_30855 [Myxococcota bacterium]|nr:hypothetical protein [Myxococcota bacterium]
MANDDDKPKKERVPYFKYAFHNVYNYTMLGGFGAAALLTQNWWLAVVGLGIETLWMVFGPDSKLLRRFYFDKIHDENLTEAARAARLKQLAGLPMTDARRCEDLEVKRLAILKLCAENRAFTNELLKEELDKMDQLVESFVDLMVSSHRYEQYLDGVDSNELERDMARYQKQMDRAQDEEAQRLASKNLEVLTQRREKIAEIRRFVQKAHGQMDLIENTFSLLGDQIVTMRSPKELGGQLDELIGGVEAVRTTARETEVFFQAVQS